MVEFKKHIIRGLMSLSIHYGRAPIKEEIKYAENLVKNRENESGVQEYVP